MTQWGVVVWVLLTLGAVRAWAQPVPPSTTPGIALDVAGCEGVLSLDDLSDSLSIEQQDVDVAAYVQEQAPRARVRCDETTVVLEVWVQERLAFTESIPKEQLGISRWVAIAVVETLAALAAAPREVIAAPAPVEPPPPVQPPPTPPVASKLWIRALGGAQLGGEPGFWSAQGMVAVELPLTDWLATEVDLVGGYGRVRTAPGQVHAIHAGLGAKLRAGYDWDTMGLSAGVGLRAGAVHWRGSSGRDDVKSSSGLGPFAAPLLVLGAAMPMSARVRLTLELEGGLYVLSANATATNGVVAELAPGWLSARVGVAFLVPGGS